MGNKRIFSILVAILILTSLSNCTVLAYDWIPMDANKVIKEAEIIVEGKYTIPTNYTNKPVGHPFSVNPFSVNPFSFKVDKYYKGTGEAEIAATIPMGEFILAKRSQERGGKYLLFLKNYSDIWIPVGGPNGMLRVVNGSIIHFKKSQANIFKKYIEEQKVILPNKSSESSKVSKVSKGNVGINHDKNSNPNIKLVYIIGLVGFFVLLFLFYRIKLSRIS
jgi:hypothetical protein